MTSDLSPPIPPYSQRVNRPELVVRNVCEKCNNGWMSQLQDGAKPIIERLWNDEECVIDLQECRVLSLWAVMTAMTLQTLDRSENWLYSEFERTIFWKHQRIPAFVGVWITHCVGHTSTYTQSRVMWTGQPEGAEPQARGNAITMAFGSLGIQVLKVAPPRSLAPGSTISISQSRGDWDRIAKQIWYLRGDSVDWPPARGIRSEAELELFAERFRSSDAANSGSDVTIITPGEGEPG
jgi:hypothetical protein